MRLSVILDTQQLAPALLLAWVTYQLIQGARCAYLIFTNRVPTDDD